MALATASPVSRALERSQADLANADDAADANDAPHAQPD